MYKRILIKVGTNLVTGEKGIKAGFLKSLVSQISALYKKGREILIVSSGAVGAGAQRMKIKKSTLSLSETQAAAAVGQIILVQEYKNIFKKTGIPVAQVLLDHDDVKHKEKNTNARNTISKLLEWKVVPIINENDTVATDEIKFGDNDALAGIVASLVNCDLVVLLTSVDGVYDANPAKNKSAKLIRRIVNINKVLRETELKGKTEGGRGGMRSKCETARNLNYVGIPVVVANGNKKGVIERIVSGKEEGTLIEKKDVKIEAKKRWILLTLKSKGKIKIDNGAKKVLLNKGKSLLAVGVSGLSGKFGFGDAVDIVDSKGKSLGKGISNYSSEDLSKIKGMKTSDIKKESGSVFYKEVIHRDNLFIYK